MKAYLFLDGALSSDNTYMRFSVAVTLFNKRWEDFILTVPICIHVFSLLSILFLHVLAFIIFTLSLGSCAEKPEVHVAWDDNSALGKLEAGEVG